MKLNWRINLVIAGFFISFFTDGIFYSFGVFLPHLLAEFKKGKSQTAWIGSLSRGHVQLIGLVVGPLTKQFGCPAISYVGGIIAAISLFLSTFAVNVLYLDFSYGILGGCAAGFCIHPAVIATTINFSKHRGLAVGIVTAGTGAGSFILSPTISWIINRFNWRACMAINGAMILIVSALAFFLHPFNPCPCCCKIVKTPTTTAPDEISVKKGDSGSGKKSLSGVSEVTQKNKSTAAFLCGEIMILFCNYRLLTQSRFIFICLGGALVSLGLFVPPMFIVQYAQSLNISSTDESSYLLSIMGATNMASRVILGAITDQRWTNILIVFILGTLVGGFTTVVAGFLTTYIPLAVYSAVFGVCLGCILSLRSGVVYDLMGPDTFHEAFGMYLLFTGIAAFVGPPLFGAVYQKYDFVTTSVSSGLVILLGMIFLLLIPLSDSIKKRFCPTRTRSAEPSTSEL